MKNINKTTKTILFATLIVAMVLPFSQIPIADAAKAKLCKYQGADGSPRCYAVAEYSPKKTPLDKITGIYTMAKFSDNNPPNGFLHDAVWLIFNDGQILEAGMFEPTTNKAKFVNVVDGTSKGTSTHSPIDGKYYKLAVHDSNGDNRYAMIADSQITYKRMDPTLKPYAAKVGVEAQFTNAPDNVTDFKNIFMHHDGKWKKLSVDNVRQGVTEEGDKWDMHPCGSGNEKMYHINAGKGKISC